MMIDASSKVSRSIVPAGILLATGVTMLMNGKFGYSLGADDVEKWAFVALGLAIDLCKVFGLCFVMAAFSKKFWLKASLGLVVWLGCVSYSFIAGIGFASMTRANITSERTHENDTIKSAKNALNTKLADLERMKTELDVMKSNQRYTSTAACSAPTERMRPESVVFCNSYFSKYNAIKDANKDVEILMAKAPKNEVIKDADPQMTFFATHLGFSIKNMVAVWALYMAIIAELVSSIGTFAFSPTRAKPRTRKLRSVSNVQVQVKRRGRPPGSLNKPKLHVVN